MVANTATATGTPPVGVIAPSGTDSTDTPITAGPALTLDKPAGTPSGNAAGDTIDYTFEVTNTGNVTLDPVSVDDPKVGAVDLPGHCSRAGRGHDLHCDVHADPGGCGSGEVGNNATATGTDRRRARTPPARTRRPRRSGAHLRSSWTSRPAPRPEAPLVTPSSTRSWWPTPAM